MKVTVFDIAKKAGVSQSTVSKVLNNYSQIKESTRDKVLQAIKELEFTPDLVARSMATNKSQTVGLILGDIANPFYSETAKVIISEAREKGYDVIVSDTNYDTLNLEKSIRNLMARRVDGILIASIDRDNTYVKDIYQSGFPIMIYNRKPDDDDINFVVLNNQKGSHLAVNHLVELGHRRISFISGSTKYSTFHQRYIGYKKALVENGIQYDAELVYNRELSYESIYEFTSKVLEKENRPTCFFAATDSLAISVMDSLIRMNIQIPNDISVIGFDNINISSSPLINLTTISQHKSTMAKLALENLLLLINEDKTIDRPIQIMVEPELIIRKTTGPVLTLSK